MAEPPAPMFNDRLVASTLPDGYVEADADPAPVFSGYSAADAPPGEPAATAESDPSSRPALAGAARPAFADASPATETNPYFWEPGQSPSEAETMPTAAQLASLGRRPLYRRPEEPLSTQEELSNVIEYLHTLRARISRAEDAAATAQVSATPGLTVLQAKRLSRSGVAPDPFEIGVLPRPPSSRAAEPSRADEPESAPAEAAPDSPPAPASVSVEEPPPPPAGPRFERRHAVWLLLTGMLCLVTLGLVAYLWTRVVRPVAAASSKNATPTASTGSEDDTRSSDDALALATRTLDAIRRNDLAAASELLSGARQKGMVLPGLYYQAALLAYSLGQQVSADSLIEQSIRARESVADCWYLRANNLFYTAGPDQAAEALDEAARADPFSPRFYFFRGECLRRNGNVAAALAQFEQALRCRPDTTDRDLILFKIGLTRVESNTDTAFIDSIHERLTHPPAAGDALLLAAAEEMGRGAYPEAAEHLRQAAGCLSPGVFQSLTRDFVFRAEVRRPEIAAALRIQPPAGVATPTPTPAGTARPAPKREPRLLIDPATRSLAEADPGEW